ncbi:PREDICTED: EPIDERMAL PATTERNING FACTOR-like protein 9 [Prunus mume]|uniref:EPIDERMAL PATTERNING FACTOR-like protein 9 n=1 Tax=Prunus mume TaxID=102107 RepID=A0ABM0PUK6_PRUMU|nr:PREDICTED: EPIDERMAL PATTERNING FACTOR-like protein 9 [Prunus mume]
MAKSTTTPKLLLLFFTLIFAAYVLQGSRTQVAALPHQLRVYDSSPPQEEQQLKQSRKETMNYARRLMIGSTAPTCTFNECRGCKFKCRAEQVPVEGNDPINSAYHYRCVCHR